MTDLVNHPSHYKTKSGLEVIDMIEQGLEKYDHRDQVLKYLFRAPKKGSYLQDLQKAQWYLNRTVQNVIDGKFSLNTIKFETYEPFDLNYNKIAFPEPKSSEEDVEVKPLDASTIEDLLNILSNSFLEEEKEPEPEFDKDYIYTDSDGDDWGWVSEHNTWSWGHDPEARSLRATIYADTEDLCAEPKPLFGPFTKKEIAPFAKKESKPVYDKEKVWKDKDGDAWECVEGAWVTGDTHEERVEAGHEMLEFGDYYTDLPNDYAPYTEVVAPDVFDESKRYLDDDGDIWGFYDGYWYFGGNPQDLEDKFGDFAHQWISPCVNIEDCTVVDASRYDTQKLYKDRDGDVWEYISGRWVYGEDHDYRASKRELGFGNLNLNEGFAPFVEIEDENGETV